ncbi:hypothetical protein [Altererythrobacter lutimaris]|uniref:Uncharacterized protein n=1 Tax=Altererythrobacter lutimaris TaxID=2743979 RepID=A0A850HH26_9SPHN|nr:hypothetical protein [Altererythrobacter lutimaris]NVE94262.1 hypothetical protein [Altererythrobacter lutimaris]
MLTLILVSLLFLLVAAAIAIGVMMTWALAGSDEEHLASSEAKPRGLRSRLRRFWSWANAVPPKLEYRRDKKGRFRKLKRW